MTVAKPPHNRRLGINGISLTDTRVKRYDMKALNITRDMVEKCLVDSGYLDGAPFHWVTLAIRYGTKYDVEPSYGKINKKFGDLPLTIEIDTSDLVDASLDDMKRIFTKATALALVHAGEKYGRPTTAMEALLEV